MTIEPNHPHYLAHPSRGTLPKTAAEKLNAYRADVEQGEFDVETLLAERRELLESGMTTIVADVLNAGESLNDRRDELNRRFQAWKQRRFDLAAELAPSFKVIAAEMDAAHERCVAAMTADFAKRGITAASYGAAANPESAEFQLRKRVESEPECLQTRESKIISAGEADSMEALGATAGNVRGVVRPHVNWPDVRDADQAIIARLAGVLPTTTTSTGNSEQRLKGGWPTDSNGQRAVSWSANETFYEPAAA